MGNQKSKASKQELNENGSRKLPTHHLPFQRKKKKIFATVKRIKNLFCKNTKKKKVHIHNNNKPSIHATSGLYSGIKTGNFTSYCSPYLLIQENISDDPLHDYWPPLHHSRLSLFDKNDEDQISKINVLNVDEDGIVTSRKSSLMDEAKNVAIQEISTSGSAQSKEIKPSQKTIPKLCNRSRSNSSNGTGDMLTCSSGSNDEFEDACSSLTDDVVMKNDISTAPTLEIIREEQLSQTSTLDVKICSEISKTITDPIVTRDVNNVKELFFNRQASEETFSNIQNTEKVEEQIKDVQNNVMIEEDEDLFKINKLSEASKVINDKLINLLEMNKEVLSNIADCNKKLITNKVELNINEETKQKNVAVILESNKQFVEEFPVLMEENEKLQQSDKSATSEHMEDCKTNQNSNHLSEKLKSKLFSRENEIGHSTTVSKAPIAMEESFTIADEPQIDDQEVKAEMIVESESIALNEKPIETNVSRNIIFNEPQIDCQKLKLEMVDEPDSILALKEKPSKTEVSKNISYDESDQFHQELKPGILGEAEPIVLNEKSIKTNSFKNRSMAAIEKESSRSTTKWKQDFTKNIENIIFDISKSISQPTIEDSVQLNEDIPSATNDNEPDTLDLLKIKNELETQQSNNSFSEDLESKLLTENVTDVIVETSFNFSPEEETSSDGNQSSVMEIDDDVWEEEAPEDFDEAPEQTAIDIKSKLVMDLLIQAEVDMEDFDAFIRLPYPLEKKYHLLQIQKIFDVHEISNNNLIELSHSLRMITKFGLDLLKPANERPRHWKKILLPLETPSCHLLPVQDAQDILLEFGYQRFENGIIFLEEEVDAEAIAAWVVELLLAAYELSSFSRKVHPQQQLFNQNFIKDGSPPLDFNGYENAENLPLLNFQVSDSPIIKESEELSVNNVEKKTLLISQDMTSLQQNLDTDVSPFISEEPSQRCHLCVSLAASIQCKQCLNLKFCSSCDDAYHRHPKRRNHMRQLIQRSKSPSSPPPSNFSNFQPIAPPRQRKSPTPNLPEHETAEFLTSPYPYLNQQQLIPQELHGTNQFQQSPMNCNDFTHRELVPSNSTEELPEDTNSFHLGNVYHNDTNGHKSSTDVNNWSLQTLPLSPQFVGSSSTVTTLDPYYQQPQTRAHQFRTMSGVFDNAQHSSMSDSPYFNNFQNNCWQSESPHYYTMCAPKPMVHSMLREINIANATLPCGCQFGVDDFGRWRPLTLCSTHHSQSVYLSIVANQTPKHLSYQNVAPLVPSIELTAPTTTLVNDDLPTQSVKKPKKNKFPRSRKTQSNAKEIEEKDINAVEISNDRQEIKDSTKVGQYLVENNEIPMEVDKIEPEIKKLKSPTVIDEGRNECNRCIFYEKSSNCAICGKTNASYQNPKTVKNDDEELELTNGKIIQIQACNNNLENKQRDQSQNLNSSVIDLELIKPKKMANMKIDKVEVEQKVQITMEESDEIKSDNSESQRQVNQNKNVVSKTIDGEFSEVRLLCNDPIKKKRKVEQLKTEPKAESFNLTKNKKWECEHCTYVNDEVNAICAVCSKTKISEASLIEPSEQSIVSQTINSQIENKSKIISKKKQNVEQKNQLDFEEKLVDEKFISKQDSDECAFNPIVNINHKITNNSVSKSEEWECEHCTVINNVNNTICSVCCKSKVKSLEKDNCVQQPVSQKILPDNEYENASNEKPIVTLGEVFPKTSVEKGDWECKHCSFINDINHTICSVCCKSKMPRLDEDNCAQLQKIIPENKRENTLKEKQNVNSSEISTKISAEEELKEDTPGRATSLNPIVKDEKRDWECKHCSFVNNYDSKICDVCCKTKTKKGRNKLHPSQNQCANSLEVKQDLCQRKSTDLFADDDDDKITNSNQNSVSCEQEADRPIEFNHECSIVGSIEKSNWECEHCTFINCNNSSICAVCCKTKNTIETLAEDADEEATTSQTINSQAENKDRNGQSQQNLDRAEHLFLSPGNIEATEKINCTFENSKSTEEPINALKSEVKSLSLPEPDKWECDHCTFVNDKNDKICSVCCKTKVLSANLELMKNEATEEPSSD